jgi:hypothetical protein
LGLSSPGQPTIEGATARLELALTSGESAAFAMHHRTTAEALPELYSQEEIAQRIESTLQAWRRWSSVHQAYEGPWEDLVYHSG